ncbi:hypothetical protein CHRYSEO8AT_470114 [Chryseobacterium sp. 8AT]|nr:hypothetical protein CHRYSEO8AT_470114 [Chryseobacterium sp. 8AT]
MFYVCSKRTKKSQSESDLFSDLLKQVKKGHWKFRQTLFSS